MVASNVGKYIPMSGVASNVKFDVGHNLNYFKNAATLCVSVSDQSFISSNCLCKGKPTSTDYPLNGLSNKCNNILFCKRVV